MIALLLLQSVRFSRCAWLEQVLRVDIELTNIHHDNGGVTLYFPSTS